MARRGRLGSVSRGRGFLSTGVAAQISSLSLQKGRDIEATRSAKEQEALAGQELGLRERKFGLLSSTLQKFFAGGAPGAGDFTSAEAPLRSAISEFRGLGREAIGTATEAADIFREGGGFGRGSIAIAEQQARQTEAAGRAGLVASGLSSSTAAIGLKTRVARDLTTAKLGIEQERTGKLATALTGLSGLQERTAVTQATGVAGLQAGIASVRTQAAQTSAGLSQALLNSFNFNL